MNSLHRVILSSLALICAVVAPVQADVERWYEIEIAGSPCGFLHESVVEEDDLIRTRTVERFVVARGGTRVGLDQTMVFEETSNGTPLRAHVELNTGGEATIRRYEFLSDGVMCEIEQHGRRWTEKTEIEDMDWLTPVEAAAFITARVSAGAKRLSYRTIDPSDQMRIIEVRSELIGHERREVRGRSLELSRWRTTTSVSPLDLIELLTKEGIAVVAEVDLGIGAMKMELVDRARAEAALSSDAPELLSTTVVPVSGMPASSEKLEKAKYLVRVQGLESFELPEGGAQRVSIRDDGALEVEIDSSRGSVATAAEREDRAHHDPSAVVDSADPAVVRFSERALRRALDDPEKRADILRTAVRRHITRKDFATAFASASDAVRDKTGDCTEHAVLLAAALRADGIPSRVATGLVHGRFSVAPKGGFAWHMWTQALINGEWIDLDATRSERFDAGHILVSTSALGRGAGEQDFASMLPMLGRLQVHVLEVDGRSVGEGGR